MGFAARSVLVFFFVWLALHLDFPWLSNMRKCFRTRAMSCESCDVSFSWQACTFSNFLWARLSSLNPDRAVARLVFVPCLDLKLNQVEQSWTKVIIYIFAVVLRQATDSSTVSCWDDKSLLTQGITGPGQGVKSISALWSLCCKAIQEITENSFSTT